jgi:hypothetical protein
MDMNVCKDCHWYLMTCDCLKKRDMRKGLAGLCEWFMPYCKTEDDYKQALTFTVTWCWLCGQNLKNSQYVEKMLGGSARKLHKECGDNFPSRKPL